MTTNQKKPIG
ncbi:unnamed protein product, partial [Allacma fusca]